MSQTYGMSGKFLNIQNSWPLCRPSGARQVLLSSNELDELRRENRIALSCLVILYVITCLARLAILSRQKNECFSRATNFCEIPC